MLYIQNKVYICSMIDKQEQAQRLKLVTKMQKIRINWAFKEYMSIYEYTFGEQSEKDKEHIRNVWSCRTIDEVVISRFEQLHQDRFRG